MSGVAAAVTAVTASLNGETEIVLIPGSKATKPGLNNRVSNVTGLQTSLKYQTRYRRALLSS